LSFHYRRHKAPSKGAKFTHTIESRPKVPAKIEVPQCAWCAMISVTTCELPSCRKPLCWKHVCRKAGGSLCPDHTHALLVQYDGFPSEQFGDRGEAYACEVRSVHKGRAKNVARNL